MSDEPRKVTDPLEMVSGSEPSRSAALATLRALREERVPEVLDAAGPLLRARARRRRALAVSALLALLVGAFAGGWRVGGGSLAQLRRPPRPSAPSGEESGGTRLAVGDRQDSSLPREPEELEILAEDPRTSRPELFRQAGDRYLDRGDLPAAVRCYRSYLRTRRQRGAVGGESWLLETMRLEME